MRAQRLVVEQMSALEVRLAAKVLLGKEDLSESGDYIRLHLQSVTGLILRLCADRTNYPTRRNLYIQSRNAVKI